MTLVRVTPGSEGRTKFVHEDVSGWRFSNGRLRPFNGHEISVLGLWPGKNQRGITRCSSITGRAGWIGMLAPDGQMIQGDLSLTFLISKMGMIHREELIFVKGLQCSRGIGNAICVCSY